MSCALVARSCSCARYLLAHFRKRRLSHPEEIGDPCRREFWGPASLTMRF
jgi:hypothetical protein